MKINLSQSWLSKILVVPALSFLAIVGQCHDGLDHSFFVHAKKEVASITSVEMHRNPYRTTYSLGDSFEFIGGALQVNFDEGEPTIVEEGFTCAGGDSFTLGKQEITVSYQEMTTTFSIDVTNLDAVVSPLEAVAIFISEIYADDEGVLAIELFNGTNEIVTWSDYELHLDYGSVMTIITLPEEATQAGTLLIANDDQAPFISETTSISASMTLDLISSITLFDLAAETAIDVIDFMGDPSAMITPTGLIDVNYPHITRSPKIIAGTIDSSWDEWRLGIDTSSLGTHALQTPLVTPELQAEAYARHIMYGAGMNAGANPQAAFEELREEYGFMDTSAKIYFIQNKNHTITGINETGKAVTNSFNDAIGRYNYLAGVTGNPGLTQSNTGVPLDSSLFRNIAIFGGIIIFFSLLYIGLRIKFKRY